MANSETNEPRRRNVDSSSSQSNNPEDLNVFIPTYPYKSSSEYATAVNQWLWQCYNWQCMTITLPYIISQTACRLPNSNADGTTDFNRNFPNTFFPNQNLSLLQSNRQNIAFQNQTNNSGAAHSTGTVYLVPSLFKRLAAEVIDFCILLLFKVLITYILVDFFDLVNLDKYDLDIIKNEKVDYQRAMEVTSEILALEVIHRFVVCIFEALFIHKGILGHGGATPGKTLMHLRVVSCETVVPLDANMVRVYPAKDLGLTWALLRSFIKNFSLAFVFPICATMYFFQYNRTAYDHICGSMVVEDIPVRANRN
ncbi:protein FAM8A1 [Parasteatoda tepidariorum]|uniref:protein FAM8A1 n=1 Tax=Parasteatoda tepidariorum TaxID=114398 RepID=UPI001C71B01A|nr:protein FAM8A1 [Parasteatoda tepidariorum]